MARETRRVSVKVSDVETFVGDRLAITWLPRRTETSTIGHERAYVCLKTKEFYDHRNGVEESETLFGFN